MRLPLSRWFPFLGWPRPGRRSLAADARAGIAVGLVLVPQAVAYAMLAGMPPITGLYAALLPAVIGVLWGSCPLLGIGPTALTAMLVAGSLAGIAHPDTPGWVELAIWLALLSGLFQILLGALRLGTIVTFLSGAVIGAFTQAAAILIVLSQVPAMLGLDTTALWMALQDDTSPGDRLTASLAAFSPGALAFGVGTAIFLMTMRRHARRWPLVLLAALVTGFISWLSGYTAQGGAVVGWLPAGLPTLSLPDWPGWQSLRLLLPMAAVLALVSFVETLGSARIITRHQRTRWNENQELIGQGLAKVASAASGGFATSTSFSRSALYLQGGALSGWAPLFTLACVVASLLWLTPALAYIPRAFLAAVIAVSVLGLVTPSWFVALWRTSRAEAGIAAATFVATLMAAPQLQWGVLTGFVLGLGHYLYQRANPRTIEVGPHPDGTLRDRTRFALPRLAPDLYAVRMDASLNFVTAARLERTIVDACRADPTIRRVLLHGSPINSIDSTGADMLSHLTGNLRDQGITLYITALKQQAEDVLSRAGVLALLPEGSLLRTEREAIEVLRQAPEA